VENRTGGGDFERIRAVLCEMCFGPRRCVYCEDSASTQIEHVRPKSLYPEATFSWENLLPACSGCNGPKNNRFAIFVPEEPEPLQVARRRGDPGIQRTGHRFVWEEMKAQRDRHRGLQELFAQAPEALVWPPMPWTHARAT
jgi:hypothetical protein